MQINKFFGILAFVTCMQIHAMEQGAILAECNSSKMVSCVFLQVDPGFIPGTTIVQQIGGEQAKQHEAALSRLANTCKPTVLSPVQNLGVYFLSLSNTLPLDTIRELCQGMPGFEQVHAVPSNEADIYELKASIAAYRLAQFDERQKKLEAAASTALDLRKSRLQANAAKLAHFKTLSARQVISKEEVLGEEAVLAK